MSLPAGDFWPLLTLGAEGLFYMLLLIFSVHVLFLGYHWFNYGTKYRTAVLALAIYLSGGAVFFLTLVTTLSLF